MKSLLFILFSLTFGFTSQPPSILINTWKIDGNAFIDKQKESYSLESKTKKIMDFGHFVTFKKDGTFHGYYTAPCGMDCFTNIYGKYKWVSKEKIQIQIDSTKQSGYCSNKISIINQKMGIFKVEQIIKTKLVFHRQ